MKNRLAAVLLVFALLVLGNGFRISAADTADKDAGEAKTVYVLTDEMTVGKEYVISNSNHATDTASALANNGKTNKKLAIKILSGTSATDNLPYIEDDSSLSVAVWSVSKGLRIKNGDCFLRNNDGTLTIDGSTTYNKWTWDASNHSLKSITGNLYLWYDNSKFTLSTDSYSVYLYEKAELEITADPSKPTSVVVEPETLDLEVGDKAQLTATVYPETAADRTVRWESADESIATVDKNGVVTALHDGTIAIRAIANDDGTVKGACNLKVTKPTSPVFIEQSLTLTTGEIGINFYVLFPDDVDKENSKVEFTVGKSTVKQTDTFDAEESKVKKDYTYYRFTANVNVLQMADTVTATLYYQQNGTDLTQEKTYAVKNYIQYYDDKTDSAADKLITLVHAIADYGMYAQLYLDDVHEWTLGEDYSAMTGYTTAFDYDTIKKKTRSRTPLSPKRSAAVPSIRLRWRFRWIRKPV